MNRKFQHGLVLGKFMPLHKGHLALIAFALKNCKTLTLLHCFTKEEPIPGAVRIAWLKALKQQTPGVRVINLEYDPATLPATSVSDRQTSGLWADEIRRHVPDIDVVFTSEPYGDYLAEFLGITHMPFDLVRRRVPVSATTIRENVFASWESLPDYVRPYFLKKICLAGTESTGKSTLAERLARHYKTTFVPEKARDIVAHTEEVVFEDLYRIADAHARVILVAEPHANKLLFIDTDIRITQSYGRFLFSRELEIPEWIAEANRMDLLLFLDSDCDFVQDGTRLGEDERNKLAASHRLAYEGAREKVISINGSWDDRFEQAKHHIDRLFFKV